MVHAVVRAASTRDVGGGMHSHLQLVARHGELAR
jgi:hypothetical protein